jgi:hypothetical protein
VINRDGVPVGVAVEEEGTEEGALVVDRTGLRVRPGNVRVGR